MNEKAEEEEFEDDDEELVADGEDVDVDHLFRDMEKRKRNAVKPGDPAWRKLEKYREERLTAELVSDFDDYDISGEGDLDEAASSRSATRHRKAS